MFGLLRPRPEGNPAPKRADAYDPSAIWEVNADEWLAGVLSLDSGSLRQLVRAYQKIEQHPYGVFVGVAERELTEMAGGTLQLDNLLSPVFAEAYHALTVAGLTQQATDTARAIALTHLGMAHRDRLSRKAKFGIYQPLMNYV